MDRFQGIVRMHQQRIYRAALRVLGDRDEALDVTQEAFLALHEHRAAVREKATGAWLLRVARNRALDRVRRRRGAPPVEAPDQSPGPVRAAEHAEESARVHAALAQLSDRQREVVTMRVMEQLTFVEIHRALNISEGAAKVHFRRGLDALRRLLVRNRNRSGR